MAKLRAGLVAASIGLVAGCGGGGSSTSTPTTVVSSFPLQAGYKALVSKGLSKPFTISGNCGGTGTRTSAPAITPSTFEGIAGFSTATTVTMSLTGCTPASSALTVTSYFDSNYGPLGEVAVGSYGMYSTPPAYPATVAIGSTGVIGTLLKYTDSTKTKSTCGSVNISYVVEADTPSTAIVNLIAKDFEVTVSSVPALTCNQVSLTSTSQSRFRIDASGTLTPLSVDTQLSNGSTMHLLYTYN